MYRFNTFCKLWWNCSYYAHLNRGYNYLIKEELQLDTNTVAADF